MKNMFLLLISALASILISCDQRNKLAVAELSENRMAPDAEVPVVSETETSQPSENRSLLGNQKIIREGSIGFETKDLKASRDYIVALCENNASYIQEEINHHTEYRLATETILRIPAEKYNDVVFKLESHAFDLTEKNIRLVDVTEQYVDIQARLKTKYELEQRYLALIKKAKNVEEVLSVEAQLSQVRYEVESMEGKMRSLNDRIAFSTLKVSFFQVVPFPEATPETYFSKLGVAFRSGWDNLLSIFVGLVFLWPFIILFTIGVFVALRRKRKPRAEVQPTT